MASMLSGSIMRMFMLDQKLKIIEELKSDKLRRLVATLHSILKSTVDGILSNRIIVVRHD